MADKIRLTEKKIADLVPIPGKQFEVWDQDQQRFGVRVSPGGSKVYFVFQRVNGKVVRVTVGKFPEMPLKDARAAARANLVTMYGGINPNDDKSRRRQENTDKNAVLLTVYNSFIESRPKLRDITKRNYGYLFAHLSAWHSKKVTDISPEMVAQRFKEITNTSGEVAANRATALLKYVMKHSMETLKRPAANPADGIKWHKERARRESMPPESIAEFIQKLDSIKGGTGKDLYMLLLFTGLRKSNALKLKWSHIDFEKGIIRFTGPEMKNDEPFEAPLSSFVIDLLTTRRQLIKSSTWVFPTNSRSGRLTNTWLYDLQLAEQGIRVYPHYLRKTFTTVASLLCNGNIVDLLTGHVPEGVTGKHYTCPSVEQLRPSVERITAELLRMAGIESAA